MPIQRSYEQKDVMYVTDFPLAKEEQNGIAYSEFSSTNLKNTLASTAIRESKSKDKKLFLSSLEICYTYLSLKRPLPEDIDWKNSICKKKDIPEGGDYWEIPYLKDTWVEREVAGQLKQLIEQIKQVKPKLIIIGGKWSLFFLAALPNFPEEQIVTLTATKNKPKSINYFGGLNKYRSSLLTLNSSLEIPTTVVFPILNPSFHWIVKEKAEIIKKDYFKIAQLNRLISSGYTPLHVLAPRRRNLIGETKEECLEYLNGLLNKLNENKLRVVFDVETRQKGIDCIGICYDEGKSFTIPFTKMVHSVLETETPIWHVTKTEEKQVVGFAGTDVILHTHYWEIEDEVEITYLLAKVMLHPNCLHIGQNYNYDRQWYLKHLKLNVGCFCDTMVLHHVLYNYMQKDLATLASLYCNDYTYWKDEIGSKDNFVRWVYNGKDVCYNLTIANVLLRQMENEDSKLQEFYRFQQEEVGNVVVTMMNRGVGIDNGFKESMREQFAEIYNNCLEKINYVFNENINLNSTPQVRKAFKELLSIEPIKDRKSKNDSFNGEAMLVYLERYPEYRSLLTLFLETKSIKVFLNTFLSMQLSDDGRLRCSYNHAGTKTYRFSSRKGVDGTGGNLKYMLNICGASYL